ncbi:MAG TPA: siderophore-interacting protein [Acidimicrobiales bacterium]
MLSAPDATSIELAKRLNAHARLFEVVSSSPLGASFHEVVLRGDPALAGVPGNDVMVRLVDAKGRNVRRRYSVRSVEEEQGLVTLWIVTSHEGAGAHWAREAKPGDQVDLVGPRGKITLDPLADWYLFAGDTSGLASFYRLAESIESPGRAIFIVEVDDINDALTAPFDEGLGVTGIFVERRGRAYDDPAGLLSGLAAFEMPANEGHAYLFGEFHVIRALGAALSDRGLPEQQQSHKAFWRAGRHNAEHGEPEKDL